MAIRLAALGVAVCRIGLLMVGLTRAVGGLALTGEVGGEAITGEVTAAGGELETVTAVLVMLELGGELPALLAVSVALLG